MATASSARSARGLRGRVEGRTAAGCCRSGCSWSAPDSGLGMSLRHVAGGMSAACASRSARSAGRRRRGRPACRCPGAVHGQGTGAGRRRVGHARWRFLRWCAGFGIPGGGLPPSSVVGGPGSGCSSAPVVATPGVKVRPCHRVCRLRRLRLPRRRRQATGRRSPHPLAEPADGSGSPGFGDPLEAPVPRWPQYDSAYSGQEETLPGTAAGRQSSKRRKRRTRPKSEGLKGRDIPLSILAAFAEGSLLAHYPPLPRVPPAPCVVDGRVDVRSRAGSGFSCPGCRAGRDAVRDDGVAG